MTWFVLALLSVVANSAMFISFKRLQQYVKIEVYLFYAWLISSFVIGLIYIPKYRVPIDGVFIIIVLVAGFLSWIGNYAYNYSISMKPNMGYIEALSSSRIGITFVASILFFSAKFELIRAIGLVGLTIGCYLVTSQSKKGETTIKRTWVIWSLLSGLCFAFLAILSKVTSFINIQVPIFTSLFLFVASFFYLATCLQKKYSILVPIKHFPLMLLSSVFAVFANLLLYSSYELAPNLAYPVAISNGRIILLFIFSLITGKENINNQKIVGIVLVFFSAIALS